MARTKKTSTQDIINIKSMPVQAHIGASKYVNDDWGTIAFVIPRNQLQLKFADIELRYNCIYFLFGFDQTTEKVYVGQAKKRNSGESVLARLREHDTSTTERYCDIWEWVIVCTGKGDTWSLDDLNALEHAFYNEIPIGQNLNGNNPNSGGANYDAYIDKIKQIKNYITSIGFSIFADTEDTEKIQVTSEVNENTIVEDLQNGLARIPEIVTPQKVVKAMCDMLPPEVWNDQTVFLDPACKGGEYLREIFDRLMDCEILQAKYPNELERSLHILKNQIYGIALSQVSFERTAKKLMSYDNIIRVISNYIRKLKGIGLGSRPDGISKTMQDILNEEFNKDMKFDVIIGNPPYQEMLGGGSAIENAKPVYQIFVNKCIEQLISGNIKYLSMIIPTSWYNVSASKDVNIMIQYILTSGKTRNIVDYPNLSDVFKGVQLSGGVCFFLLDYKHTGKKCEVVTRIGDSESKQDRILDEFKSTDENYNIFIRNKIGAEIVRKVTIAEGKKCNTLNKFVFPSNIFKLNTNADIDIIKIKDNDITVIKSFGDYGHIRFEELEGGKDIIDKFKVITGYKFQYCKDNKSNMQNVINKPKILNRMECCTQTYNVIGVFNSYEGAISYESYLKTRFTRFLIYMALSGQNITKKCFAFVPVQDFTHLWTDEMLYKKYNLSQEEIYYIESTIKPMN